jgi:predicted small secreted protein
MRQGSGCRPIVKEHAMKRYMSWFTTVLLIAAVVGVSACNTVAGVGKDVSKAGEAVEKAAERAKK